VKAQTAKEQVSKTMTYLTRELSSIVGPLLSDTLDANHLACYLALEAEKNCLAPNMFKGDCVFTVMEMWQQCAEMVHQSGGDNKHFAALADEEWLDQQYRNLMMKRREQSLADDSEPLRTVIEVIKRWIVGAAQRLQATKNLEGVKPGEAASVLSKVKAADTDSTGLINDVVREQ
jgi:hypothetical protein